jgi:hypothetical protein
MSCWCKELSVTLLVGGTVYHILDLRGNKRLPSRNIHKLLTYLLNPWSRVFLEKPTGFQLLKKFPALYGNPKVHYRIHKCPPPVPVLIDYISKMHLKK